MKFQKTRFKYVAPSIPRSVEARAESFKRLRKVFADAAKVSEETITRDVIEKLPDGDESASIHWLTALIAHEVSCPSCGGSGRYTLANGDWNTCYACRGTGAMSHRDIKRQEHYWAERERKDEFYAAKRARAKRRQQRRKSGQRPAVSFASRI